MISRRQNDYGSQANRKIITLTPDGATQWSKPAFHAGLWEPRCMASIRKARWQSMAIRLG